MPPTLGVQLQLEFPFPVVFWPPAADLELLQQRRRERETLVFVFRDGVMLWLEHPGRQRQQ